MNRVFVPYVAKREAGATYCGMMKQGFGWIRIWTRRFGISTQKQVKVNRKEE
jgi:hypothetical protein